MPTNRRLTIITLDNNIIDTIQYYVYNTNNIVSCSYDNNWVDSAVDDNHLYSAAAVTPPVHVTIPYYCSVNMSMDVTNISPKSKSLITKVDNRLKIKYNLFPTTDYDVLNTTFILVCVFTFSADLVSKFKMSKFIFRALKNEYLWEADTLYTHKVE